MMDGDGSQKTSGVDELARTVVTDDVNLSEALGRVAGTGSRLLMNCAGASVTLVDRGRAITVGSSNELAQSLDDAQYAADEGPCLSAARDGVMVRMMDARGESRWPHFATAALEHGVRSSLSTPLTLSREETVGGFNVYNVESDGFSDDDEQLCRSFANQASVVVSNVQAYWAAFDLSNNLSKAMESRATIEQAKGILMSTQRVGADAAFESLRQRSQAENRKLRSVADDVIREALEDERA
ncbi:MAG: GAF and ANTAR domain-containing protein [Ilumatobacteraceae bacterium]